MWALGLRKYLSGDGERVAGDKKYVTRDLEVRNLERAEEDGEQRRSQQRMIPAHYWPFEVSCASPGPCSNLWFPLQCSPVRPPAWCRRRPLHPYGHPELRPPDGQKHNDMLLRGERNGPRFLHRYKNRTWWQYALLSLTVWAHLCLLDFGVCVEELFDLGRVNVLSSSDDHVFNPAVDLAVAVRVHAADVSAGKHQRQRLKSFLCLYKSFSLE